MKADPVRPDLATATESSTLAELRRLMATYTTDRLVGVPAGEFRAHLESLVGSVDADSEGYADASRQRDLSIKFRFGHDHDFGDFRLDGQMGDRHLHLLAQFIDGVGGLPMDLTGKRVLDIGCWTGGTCLLLAAMGAEVVAIEEVRKYASCAQYLADSFGLRDRVRVIPSSLYHLHGADHEDSFDFVLFAGVLYHLTDPVLALRRCFNLLRDGGTCLIETAGIAGEDSLCRYEGAGVFHAGSAEQLNRSGWNWFLPTRLALRRMIADVGFGEAEVAPLANNRLLAWARRDGHVDMLRAGLSVPSVR